MDNLTVTQVRKLLEKGGVIISAQVSLNDDDIVNVRVPKEQVYLALKGLEGKTKTRWSYLEEHGLLVMG